jgi:hypothetical protein
MVGIFAFVAYAAESRGRTDRVDWRGALLGAGTWTLDVAAMLTIIWLSVFGDPWLADPRKRVPAGAFQSTEQGVSDD